jgi:alkanesulfonate monooxygenase SsuD/methylene tetrahydromethanopterin reductase-like flavin-dependent oxidoreductase (luciferase family)
MSSSRWRTVRTGAIIAALAILALVSAIRTLPQHDHPEILARAFSLVDWR